MRAKTGDITGHLPKDRVGASETGARTIEERARAKFDAQAGIQNFKKIQSRRALLAEDPTLRIRLDFAKLRSILDVTAFRCSPYSSVARDESIKGSDIDGGVVVTKTKAPVARQQAFVLALRAQGFAVYHAREAAAEEEKTQRMEAELERSGVSPFDQPDETFFKQARKSAMMEDQTLRFYSEEEMRALIEAEGEDIEEYDSESTHHMDIATFLAGADLSVRPGVSGTSREQDRFLFV